MDKVVGGLLQFGSSPKSAALQRQFDKASCRGAEPNFLPFGWLFFQPDGILQTLKNISIKSGIYYVLHFVTLYCILLFLYIAVQTLKSSFFIFDGF